MLSQCPPHILSDHWINLAAREYLLYNAGIVEHRHFTVITGFRCIHSQKNCLRFQSIYLTDAFKHHSTF